MKKLFASVILVMVLSACASKSTQYFATPGITSGLSNESAQACVRIARTPTIPAPSSPHRIIEDKEKCRIYFDLLFIARHYDELFENITPPLSVTPPIGCPLDGPNCPMFSDYNKMLNDAFSNALAGDPSPQPSVFESGDPSPGVLKPLIPFEVLSADIQLNRVLQIRDALEGVVKSLDAEVSYLEKADASNL